MGKYFVAVALNIVVVVILLVASPALGGGIRGRATHTVATTKETTTNKGALSITEARRILDIQDEEEEEEEEETEEAGEETEEEEEEEEEEYVPVVSANCSDSEGLVEVSVNVTLNCKKIRKSRICDREHNGHFLYESCEKSCGICVEPVPTTDAPTQDLAELVLTDMPTDEAYYNSTMPSYQPTIRE